MNTHVRFSMLSHFVRRSAYVYFVCHQQRCRLAFYELRNCMESSVDPDQMKPVVLDFHWFNRVYMYM